MVTGVLPLTCLGQTAGREADMVGWTLSRRRDRLPHWLWMALVSAFWVGLMVSPAWAHAEAGTGGGLWRGFIHPILGLDHLVAMVAVGLWGAFLGAPAIWALPVVFPMVMIAGGVLGVLNVALPAVDLGVAASAVVLGGMVIFAAKPPLWIASVIVAAFAVFHGHAHGTSLLEAANPLGYSTGFVVATGLLHVAGIAFGLLVRWPFGRLVVRALGGVIVAIGAAFLSG